MVRDRICQLIANKKLHTGCRSIDTINDLERRNSPYFAFFSLNSIAALANYVTVVEDRPILSVKYCLPVPVFHFSEIINPSCSTVSLGYLSYLLVLLLKL